MALSNEKYFAVRRLLMAAGLIFAVAALAACAPYQARRRALDYKAHGSASWYGPGFSGNKTANGERFDPQALTAAHRTLPMGTTLKVTNVDNGRSVVVRVNDRGPFVRSRIIDLSKAAAQRIGLLGAGTGQVELIALSGPAERMTPVETAALQKKKKKAKGSPEVQELPPPTAVPPPAPDNRRFNPKPRNESEPNQELYQQERDVQDKTGMPPETDQF